MTSPPIKGFADRTRLEPDGPNALARAIGLLGDEWTLLILRYAMSGRTRYTEFAAELPISNAVLTGRLDTLVRESLMERQVYQQHPVRAAYVLTPRGRNTWPLLAAIWAWERKWVPEHGLSTPPMTHRLCGKEMAPLYCCQHCQEPVPPTSLHTDWGPSGGWRRTVPEVRTRRRSDTRNGNRVAQHSFYPDTMAVLGNRWSSAIVGAAFRGIRRFTDFQELLGAPPSLLADRLSSLCEHGVLVQEQVESRPDWPEYKLTPKGLDFFPAIAIAVEWAERWYTSHEGPVLTWTHAGCGAPFRGVLTCDGCRRPLKPVDIDFDESA